MGIMNWTKICIKAVWNAFDAADKNLNNDPGKSFGQTNAKGDITYKIDKIVEEAIINKIPEDTFILSEESERKKDSEFIVLVDPVCGSFLAKRGSSRFSIGLAVYTKDMKPICDIIGIMNTKDVYHADKTGAFKNGNPIKTSSITKFMDASVSVEIYHPDERKAVAGTKLFQSDNKNVSKIPGKDHFALVAEGLLDAHVALGNTYVATEMIGAYLVKQAGGIVTNKKGEEIKIKPDMNFHTSVICSSTVELHKEILKLL
jgi:fructose-1,6-bisphosphatase/inositol monophosphatase family enzyme